MSDSSISITFNIIIVQAAAVVMLPQNKLIYKYNDDFSS